MPREDCPSPRSQVRAVLGVGPFPHRDRCSSATVTGSAAGADVGARPGPGPHGAPGRCCPRTDLLRVTRSEAHLASSRRRGFGPDPRSGALHDSCKLLGREKGSRPPREGAPAAGGAERSAGRAQGPARRAPHWGV